MYTALGTLFASEAAVLLDIKFRQLVVLSIASGTEIITLVSVGNWFFELMINQL